MGRGSSGAKTANKSKSRFQANSQTPAAPQKKNAPLTGAKVQSDYISYVKKQLNIDLSKARDTQFDSRSGFNIDTRQISSVQLGQVKNLARKYPGEFDVTFNDNGANRLMIAVKRKKK